MAAAAIDLDLSELVAAELKLDRLLNFDRAELLQGLGALLESQTKRRIEVEKAAPDGTPWPAWSPEYAEQRPGGTSLLQSGNHLLQSVINRVEDESVLVGSPLVYARIHNNGAEQVRQRDEKGRFLKADPAAIRPGIPARQFLGISADNQSEIEAETILFLNSLLQ